MKILKILQQLYLDVYISCLQSVYNTLTED